MINKYRWRDQETGRGRERSKDVCIDMYRYTRKQGFTEWRKKMTRGSKRGQIPAGNCKRWLIEKR